MFAFLNQNFNKHGKINVVFGANDCLGFCWETGGAYSLGEQQIAGKKYYY